MGFVADSVRLLKMAKKPSRQEIWIVIKVTFVGMTLLGLIGFIIQVVGQVFITQFVQ